MAATAAAAVGSSFSTTMQSLRCIHSSKNYPSDHLLINISPSTRVASSMFHSLSIEPVSISAALYHKWQVPQRISAAVAQEEAAAPVEAEEEVEQEEVLTGGGEADDEGVSDDSSSSTTTTKLYFGNLPYHCDSAQLAGIIQDYASPELVEVLYNRDTGRSRGFAFVTMSTTEDCRAVIQNLDGSQYGGRTLRVNFSDKPRAKEPLYPETEYKLFVGNLAWSVTAESLTQAFQEYGNVVGARVLYDGETGRSRGYGFVCYPTQSEMETALQALNGVELEGRALRVSLAEGKRQ